MTKDDTLQVIVDDSENDLLLEALSDPWNKSRVIKDQMYHTIKKLKSTVSRLQSEKDDANLYNKRKLQSQILILEQVMEEL